MRKLGLTIGCCAVLATRTAAAADEAVCKDSYEQAQVLMRPDQGGQSSLLEARERLRTCMRAGCKDWMIADCSKWLGEVEQRIPTVVFAARNTAGRDLTDVTVTSETGGPIVSKLDGRTVEMDPGERTFVFVEPGGGRRERRVLVREGEKAQNVVATFDATPEELASAELQHGAPPRSSAATSRGSSTMRVVGYGIGGAGIVGLGLGAFFGFRAMSEKAKANCDPVEKLCDAEPLDTANSSASVATAGFIVGGMLLAGGIALVLLSPSTRSRLDARASIGPSGGSFGIGGAW
jgi:hypothetical protein